MLMFVIVQVVHSHTTSKYRRQKAKDRIYRMMNENQIIHHGTNFFLSEDRITHWTRLTYSAGKGPVDTVE